MAKREGTPRGLIPDFGVMEVIEAESEMQIVVGEAAVRESHKRHGEKDPFNCVFACAIELSAPKTYFKAVVFKKTTYIDQLCTDGKRRLVRYRNGGGMVKELSYFDRTGKWRPAAFHKPFVLTKSTTSLSHMRKYTKRWERDVAPIYREEKRAGEILRTANADVTKATQRFERVKAQAVPTSKTYREAREQVQVAKSNLTAARERFDSAKAAVTEYQSQSHYHGTGKATPKKFDARVRRGIGALVKHRSHKKAA